MSRMVEIGWWQNKGGEGGFNGWNLKIFKWKHQLYFLISLSLVISQYWLYEDVIIFVIDTLAEQIHFHTFNVRGYTIICYVY